jgi:DNA polymerase-3 subunit gamma/tau
VVEGAAPEAAPAPERTAEVPQALLGLATLADALALIKPRDFRLHDQAEAFVRLVRYRPGLIEFNPAPGAPADLAGRIGSVLRAATGERWAVLVSDAEGQPTITEERRAAEDEAKREAENHPLVAAALATFPGATISGVRPLTPPPEPEYLAAIPEDDDEDADLLDDDDPFQEDM